MLRSALLPVLRPAFVWPLVAGLLVPAVTVGWLDLDDRLTLLRYTGVALACATLAAVDDPSGEVLAAAPRPRWLRTTSRVVIALAIVVPAWTMGALVVAWRDPDLPLLPLGLEAAALTALGLGVAAGLRAWRDLHQPATHASLGLLAIVTISGALPRWYALQDGQTWGPPWTASHLRWTALLLLGTALVVAAVADPLAGRRRRSA